MGEGQRKSEAGPRSIPELRQLLREAEAADDYEAVWRLRQELSEAADAASAADGGKRGS